MMRNLLIRLGMVGLIAACVLDTGGRLQAQRRNPDGYISGTVRSSNGPEAGVWVIAETKDLPTNFIKIVVTGDAGVFVAPSCRRRPITSGQRVRSRRLEAGSVKVDSTTPSSPDLTLTATPAATPQEAAKVYPGNYWLSLPSRLVKSEFPAPVPRATASVRRC